MPPELLDVLRSKAICFVTTIMPDGSPQITQTWVDTDGEHILINTVDTHQKARNVARDPRVAIGVADPAQPHRSWNVRGSVVSATKENARAHIDGLSQRYLGRPYPGFGAGERLLLTVRVEKLHVPR